MILGLKPRPADKSFRDFILLRQKSGGAVSEISIQLLPLITYYQLTIVLLLLYAVHSELFIAPLKKCKPISKITLNKSTSPSNN
jgi:hypothetical protein